MKKNKVLDSERIKFRSPIPTRIISNGEYDPIPQTAEQKQVEKFISEKSHDYANEMGISRRDFLASAAGISLGLLALNKIFGHYFNISPKDVTGSIIKKSSNQIIIDVQTHMIKDGFHHKNLEMFAKWGMRNGVITNEFPGLMDRYKLPNYLKEVFVDSETDMAFLSGAPFDSEDCISNELIMKTVDTVNDISKGRLMEGYYVVDPAREKYIEEIEEFFKRSSKPIGWKVFPMGEPMSHEKKPWRLDDEKLIYPFYELATKLNIKNICIHKGLIPKEFEHNYPDHYNAGKVDDLEKAAKDWPNLNFIVFHSALKSFHNKNQRALVREFYKSGKIDWTTDLIHLSQKSAAGNIFAEIGTSFASCCITYPDFCAAFLGQLVNEMGAEKVLWGTDAVWYGSPQWQIEAFRRFQIPDAMMKHTGWKNDLGESDLALKNKIFGGNAMKLFGLSDGIKKRNSFENQWIQEMKNKVSDRSNMYYGYHV